MGWQAERRRKLALQAEPAESQLFRGIAFYLNGRSGDLSALRLSKLIQRYGGVTTPGPSASTSYVIGTALAGGKMQRYLASKSWRASAAATMLRPEWIHACIAAGMLVPITEYLVVVDRTMHQIDRYTRPASDGTTKESPAPLPTVAPAATATSLPAAAPPSAAANASRIRRSDSAAISDSAVACPRGVQMRQKLAKYRESAQEQAARRLQRFDDDAEFQARVLTKHADRQSFAASLVRQDFNAFLSLGCHHHS
jgi:hypothetical protein